MTTERRFLLSSSLARLIQREQGVVGRVAEGHFFPKPTAVISFVWMPRLAI